MDSTLMQQTDGNKVAFRIMEGSKVGTFFQFFFQPIIIEFQKKSKKSQKSQRKSENNIDHFENHIDSFENKQNYNSNFKFCEMDVG